MTLADNDTSRPLIGSTVRPPGLKDSELSKYFVGHTKKYLGMNAFDDAELEAMFTVIERDGVSVTVHKEFGEDYKVWTIKKDEKA